MNTSRLLPALLTCLLAAPVWAQSAREPLNLKLPPGALPAPASSSAKPASSAPGMYYGDTSGSTSHVDEHATSTPHCDDATYSQPQIHGSVGMGVMAGHHASGNYQSGTVNVTKQLGDCDQPKGAVSFSIGVSQGHLHGRGW